MMASPASSTAPEVEIELPPRVGRARVSSRIPTRRDTVSSYEASVSSDGRVEILERLESVVSSTISAARAGSKLVAETPYESDSSSDESDIPPIFRHATTSSSIVEPHALKRRQTEIEMLYNHSTSYIPPPPLKNIAADVPGKTKSPRLNILILIVGSRGDVQPFLAFGKELKCYGHRVRLATHANFKDFVKKSGLEFYPLAGDPAELMAYMVKNPGLLPSISSIAAGDIGKKRRQIADILESSWQACIDTKSDDPDAEPFTVDAIISNPPVFAHVHISERLNVPLHIYFTMPWSPTRAFPHPLTTVKPNPTLAPSADPDEENDGSDKPKKDKSARRMNYISYEILEMMTWQGLGDIINDFRTKILNLEPLGSSGAYIMQQLKIPHTYCWSPGLIPKPVDWGKHIDICGFFFLDEANQNNYTPPDDLARFLRNGEKPVYIGFGSIVIDDPDKLTKTLLTAVKKSGVRAIISKGWSGIGKGKEDTNEDIFFIDAVPHDWLFLHVAAVCHHGGAGTTAAGLRAGLPTIIVPFFGDQPFWGAMCASMGVGPAPIPHQKLTVARLVKAFEVALDPLTVARAKDLGERLRQEQGALEGLRSFHRHLPANLVCCEIEARTEEHPRAARWIHTASGVHLSDSTFRTLEKFDLVSRKDVEVYTVLHGREAPLYHRGWIGTLSKRKSALELARGISASIMSSTMESARRNMQTVTQSASYGLQVASTLGASATFAASAVGEVPNRVKSGFNTLGRGIASGVKSLLHPGSNGSRSRSPSPNRQGRANTTPLSSERTENVDQHPATFPRMHESSHERLSPSYLPPSYDSFNDRRHRELMGLPLDDYSDHHTVESPDVPETPVVLQKEGNTFIPVPTTIRFTLSGHSTESDEEDADVDLAAVSDKERKSTHLFEGPVRVGDTKFFDDSGYSALTDKIDAALASTFVDEEDEALLIEKMDAELALRVAQEERDGSGSESEVTAASIQDRVSKARAALKQRRAVLIRFRELLESKTREL